MEVDSKRAPNGILLLDKQSGISSAKALAAVKRALGAAAKCKVKLGHAGTLDPLASGLLVCLLGSATRLAQYINHDFKDYSGVIQFGITTTTDDIDGETLSRQPVSFDFSQVEQAASKFVGEISQIPPQISALKVNGKRAYALARAGNSFTLLPRMTVVKSFQVIPLDVDKVRFELVCSSGTYVRAIARDLGAALGVGGCIAELRRDRIGPFSAAAAFRSGHYTDEQIMDFLAPWHTAFPDAPTIEITVSEHRSIQNGVKVVLDQVANAHKVSALAGTSRVVLYKVGSEQNPSGFLELSAGGVVKFGLDFSREFRAQEGTVLANESGFLSSSINA